MKRIIALLTTAMVGLGLAVAVATPAHAAWNGCTQGYVCIWDGTGGTGTLLDDQAWNVPGSCYNLASADNDKADSFWNRMPSRSVQFYQHAGCTGNQLAVQNYFEGPFGPNYSGTFWAGHISTDRNKLTSIWFF